MMTHDEEITAYQDVLEKALGLLCEAMGKDPDCYDGDKADFDCYMDCFHDAAGVIKQSGIKYDDDEGEFVAT